MKIRYPLLWTQWEATTLPEKTIKGCEIFLNNNLNVKLIIFGKKKFNK